MHSLSKLDRKTAKSEPKTKDLPDQPAPVKARRPDPLTVVVQSPRISVDEIKAEQQRLQALIAQREHPHAADDHTEQLVTEPLDILKLLRSLVTHHDPVPKVEYRLLPYHTPSQLKAATGPVWRIELHGSKLGLEPLGIDVNGDVVIGRGADCDLDLAEYDAYEFGVSRRHALLRPANRHLFLMDMGSSNGTFYNMIPLGRGLTHALQDADVITLGKFNMTIKIIKQMNFD